MDDGSADGHAVLLNTQSFSHADNLALATLMWEKFGLEARLNRDKDGFRLRIAAGSRGARSAAPVLADGIQTLPLKRAPAQKRRGRSITADRRPSFG
jgi:LAGLIDADG DNA endonuclease family